MSKGIDYSKWDHMNFSDDEEQEIDDDNDIFEQTNVPRVTRLNEPSRITCTQDGSIHIEKSDTHHVSATDNQTTKHIKNDDNVEPQKKKEQKISAMSSSSISCSSSIKISNHLTRNGGSYVDPILGTQSYWSQDRYEVTLSVVFKHTKISSRDIRVHVDGGLSYKDRFSAVGGSRSTSTTIIQEEKSDSKGTIHVTTTNGIDIFKGDLAYYIYYPEGEEHVDWEIDGSNPDKKLVKITLLKALPMQGITIWWSKPVLNYPEIDVVYDIDGRNTNNQIGDDNQTSKQEQMKAVWDEAHRMFREKIKTREKQIIDI